MSTWLKEFGAEYAIPAAVLKLVTAGKLTDTSWRNDVCPSFALTDSNLVLWTDHPEADMRELPNPRYLVTIMDDGKISTVKYDGESLDDALQAMRCSDDEVTA